MNDPMKQVAAAGVPMGLVCRTCGCRHFHVLYTRRASRGRLMRRRECRHCGRRVTTSEQVVGK